MATLSRIAAVVTGVVLWSTFTVAQERLDLLTVVDGQPRMVEVDATVHGFGDILKVTPLTDVSPLRWQTPVALAGGRYLVWTASSPSQPWDIVVFDRRTTRRFYAGLVVPPGFVPTGLIADPRRPRLFVLASIGSPVGPTEIWVVDARIPGIRRLVAFPSFVYGPLYAPDADLLFVRMAGSQEFVAVDIATGAAVRRFPDTLGVGSMAVDGAATRLWHGAGPDGVQRIDARTGVVEASSGTGQLAELLLDEPRGWLLGIEPPDRFSGELATALDAATLAPLGRARVSAQLPGLLRSVALLPGRWLTGVYAVRTETRPDLTCNAIAVDAIGADGTKRATVDVLRALGLAGGSTGCFVSAVLVRSPFAPTALAAAVAGGHVSLTWTDPGDTSEFELEYGFGPGHRAGTVRVGQTAQLTIPGVPAGTYYVRVRAFNEVGGSPPSNEIRVVVQ